MQRKPTDESIWNFSNCRQSKLKWHEPAHKFGLPEEFLICEFSVSVLRKSQLRCECISIQFTIICAHIFNVRAGFLKIYPVSQVTRTIIRIVVLQKFWASVSGAWKVVKRQDRLGTSWNGILWFSVFTFPKLGRGSKVHKIWNTLVFCLYFPQTWEGFKGA